MANNYLVVIDMQKDFVDGALGTPEAQVIVDDVAAYARAFEGTVVFTRDTHEADYLQTQEGRNLPVEHCIRDTPGWQLVPALEAVRADRQALVFDKPTFGSVELVWWLAQRNDEEPIDSIEVIGLCTDICVVSNALLIKAHFPEIPVRTQAHLCAGVTPAAHEAALTTMRSCQVEVSE
ncbi:cysteine hydrolase family protein [Collinsella tanakaei]|uniref:cysteine hydrolase family protein n=1 Tax=Collinsella tanakaei TaxID=626935 RepID=UPI0025A35C66|nr:isochorismatase family cysteine hydrolase [Collinsella tanakaei]MDM8302838.1 isochorismatase family cysteine hydrolase [Collinsella tanakaei]